MTETKFVTLCETPVTFRLACKYVIKQVFFKEALLMNIFK